MGACFWPIAYINVQFLPLKLKRFGHSCSKDTETLSLLINVKKNLNINKNWKYLYWNIWLQVAVSVTSITSAVDDMTTNISFRKHKEQVLICLLTHAAHRPNSSNKCQLKERETVIDNKQTREMESERQTDREREREKEREGGWKCAGNAEATFALLLLQNPDWTWKRLYCSCDGRRALTSVHQPRAASLFHLFWLLWFPLHYDASVMRDRALLWFSFFSFFFSFFFLNLTQTERIEKICSGRWWDRRENEENNFGQQVPICSAPRLIPRLQLFRWS